MRKWFSTLGYTLSILTAILLLLPLCLGYLAERKCKQMVETINTTTPLSAKIIEYRRGWFSADATAEVSLDKLDLPNPDLHRVTITASITHGPMLIDWIKFYFVQGIVDATINLNTIQNQWLKREPNAQPIATVKIKFKINGNTDITLNSPPLIYQGQENSLNWHGLEIRAIFSPLYNQIKSKINFSGIDIKTKDGEFHLGEISSLYQGNRTSTGIWLGERKLQFTSFSITNTNNRGISFNEAKVSNLTTEHENLANISTTIAINNLNINGATYSLNILDLEIVKLDQTLLTKLQQQLITSKIVLTPASLAFDMLMAIANNGSEINIKQLDTTTPWGKLLATVKIAFANKQNSFGLLATITNSNINATIKTERALALHLAEKFYKNIPSNQSNDTAKQAETLLTHWQNSGKILTSNEDNFLHLTFDYKNNQPSINGKQLILTTKP